MITVEDILESHTENLACFTHLSTSATKRRQVQFQREVYVFGEFSEREARLLEAL